MVLTRARTSLKLRRLDLQDRLSGRADALVPPRRLDFSGHSDYVDTGDEFLGYFTELAGLEPSERVLDVGCGIGRMARPLTRYLDATGSYLGFDVNPKGIAWCRARYADRPNFTFEQADLFNAVYHPQGTQSAVEYRFPVDDASVDLVILTSVLTHLLEDEAVHYLSEVARVLKPGGRTLATFFLLDDASRALIAGGSAGFEFADTDEHIAVLADGLPEEAVAYDADWVRGVLERNGLSITSVHPGSWSGRASYTSFQDLVIAHQAS